MLIVLTMRVKKKIDLLKRLETVVKGDYREFLNPAIKMIRDDVISNIRHQITPDGTALKRNAQSTLLYKQKYGLGNKSLIAKFRLFISESTYRINVELKRATIELAEVRKEIGRILEERGYHFWGISEVIKKKVWENWREFISRGLKRG